MNIFIDCEWDGHKGRLISMALVSEDGREFYEVIDFEYSCSWALENVIPILNKEPVNEAQFKAKLKAYLSQFSTINLIADWPEDIKHFCDQITSDFLSSYGHRKFTCMVDERLFRAKSRQLHNALEDARAIRREFK